MMFGKIVCAFKRWRSRRELVKGYGLDAKVLKANVKMAKNLGRRDFGFGGADGRFGKEGRREYESDDTASAGAGGNANG
jgi:hypothetical protein